MRKRAEKAMGRGELSRLRMRLFVSAVLFLASSTGAAVCRCITAFTPEFFARVLKTIARPFAFVKKIYSDSRYRREVSREWIEEKIEQEKRG